MRNHPLLVVELAHQLDDEIALLCKSTVGALEHIAAEFAACLLQGRNGAGCGHTSGSAALRHVPVAADLLQLFNAALAVTQAVALQARRLQRTETVVVEPSHHMHDVPAEIGQLFLVRPLPCR